MYATTHNGLTLYRFDNLSRQAGIDTFVTPRSTATGSDFNLGLYAGGDTSVIEANLTRLCEALELSRSHLIFPEQTHGNAVAVVDEKLLSMPRHEQQAALYGKDALVTDIPGIALAVATADCVPVLLYDPDTRAIAAIHAGWRGTVAKIVSATVATLTRRYGTDPAHLYAAIAPCIGVASYEVGDEVVVRFTEAGFDDTSIMQRNAATGKAHIDLAAANTDLLLQCGVELSHIEVCGIDTFTACDTFYSVRALGATTGRFLTGIAMRSV